MPDEHAPQLSDKSWWDLKQEADALRRFAQDVMEGWYEGGIDGAELQEIAEKHGLLIPREMPEPCGENCSCASSGADFPAICYRKTPLLTGSGELAESPWKAEADALLEALRLAPCNCKCTVHGSDWPESPHFKDICLYIKRLRQSGVPIVEPINLEPCHRKWCQRCTVIRAAEERRAK